MGNTAVLLGMVLAVVVPPFIVGRKLSSVFLGIALVSAAPTVLAIVGLLWLADTSGSQEQDASFWAGIYEWMVLLAVGLEGLVLIAWALGRGTRTSRR